MTRTSLGHCERDLGTTTGSRKPGRPAGTGRDFAAPIDRRACRIRRGSARPRKGRDCWQPLPCLEKGHGLLSVRPDPAGTGKGGNRDGVRRQAWFRVEGDPLGRHQGGPVDHGPALGGAKLEYSAGAVTMSGLARWPVPSTEIRRCPPNTVYPSSTFPRCRAAWMPLKQRRRSRGRPRRAAPASACPRAPSPRRRAPVGQTGAGTESGERTSPAPTSGSRTGRGRGRRSGRGRGRRFRATREASRASRDACERVSGHFLAWPLPVWPRQSRSGAKGLRKKIRHARATD